MPLTLNSMATLLPYVLVGARGGMRRPWYGHLDDRIRCFLMLAFDLASKDTLKKRIMKCDPKSELLLFLDRAT